MNTFLSWNLKTFSRRNPALVVMLLTAGLLLLASLLSGCGLARVGAPSPQAAVQEAIIQDGGPGNMQVDPNSVQLLQQQNLQETTFILARFNSILEGKPGNCLFLYEVRRLQVGWQVGSSGGACGSFEERDQPFSVGVGGASFSGGMQLADGSAPQNYAEVDGLVFDDEIDTIAVDWSDGMTQETQVVNDSYLAVRSGSLTVTSVRALNAAGETVYTHRQEPPAEGKQ